MNEAFGMMDEGYFKPRTEILKFINDLLSLNVTKIESLGQGAVYCQILDALFNGKVPLSKVNWKAKLEWEFVNNLKILQTAFTKLGIKRVIEVERLSKCKYQDNLEMIQWMMRFYETNGGRPAGEYDAVARRKGAEPDFSYSDKTVIPKIFLLSSKQPTDKPAEKPVQPKKAPEVSSKPQIASSTTTNHTSVSEKERKTSISNPALKPKQDTPLEKLEKIKRLLLQQGLPDDEKLSAISKVIGVKNQHAHTSVLNQDHHQDHNEQTADQHDEVQKEEIERHYETHNQQADDDLLCNDKGEEVAESPHQDQENEECI